MKALVDNLRFVVRSWCGRSPLLIKLIGVARGFGGNVCSDRTDIVIEAFPRSANTYCVAVFRTLSNDQLSIASHMHASAQFHLAEQLNKPALLIIREPINAISSLAIRRPMVKKRLLIKEYIVFHKEILHLIDRGKLSVVSFDAAVNDKRLLPELARSLFGNDMDFLSMPGKEFEEKVIDLVESMERQDSGGSVRETHVARPSIARDKLKKNVMSDLLKERQLLEEASSIYRTIIKNAVKLI